LFSRYLGFHSKSGNKYVQTEDSLLQVIYRLLRNTPYNPTLKKLKSTVFGSVPGGRRSPSHWIPYLIFNFLPIKMHSNKHVESALCT
ncbi:hypothetical protein ATANTOWER_002200, partial [Ataeniobius toweri]|nr:hypothetical protein [Ataeniobius toweri]